MSPYNYKIIITHNLVSSIIFICNFQIHEFSRMKEFKDSIMLITNFVNLLRFFSVQYGIGIGLEALTTSFVQTRITVVKRNSLEGRECALFETRRCSDVCQFQTFVSFCRFCCMTKSIFFVDSARFQVKIIK